MREVLIGKENLEGHGVGVGEELEIQDWVSGEEVR